MTKQHEGGGTPDVGSTHPSSAETLPLDSQENTDTLLKGRYQVERELGRGGVGVVYLAKDRQLHNKPVVIKVLLDESSEDAWYKKKFRQEVEALARLDHPGIVGVIDSGETPEGKPFLVMQYVKGASLRSMIKNEGMDFEDVAQIIRQIGLAVTSAHEQKIYHCDLKPENIMLQDLGEGELQVKVVDFGIAKITESQVASNTSTKVAGTLPYMAPEQIAGKPSAASDIYAMGVIAYEMLTGRRPFNVNSLNPLDTLRAGVRIKPKDLRQDLPEAAQEVILKALSFNPEDRQTRARDFGELLAHTLTTELEAAPAGESGEGADLEMAHVLFMDIVGYSKLPSDQQTIIYKQLQQVVSGAEMFQRAKATRQLVSRSTGDGMALVFFSGPKAAAQCAVEVARALRSLPEIKLRIGINSGPVYRVKDMNETVDVAGAGINMAQRVMDCGDAGHILLSTSTADVLKELGDWRDHVHDLGEHRVKHGVSIHLYNLYVNEVGNPKTPEKLRKKRAYSMAIAAGSVALVAIIALVAWLIFWRPSPPQPGDASKENPAATAGTQPITSEPLRTITYSLTVQKFQGNKMDGPEFQLADGNIIFNPKYQIKVNVTTPQPGYFYVLNEAAEGSRDAPIYVMLYPANADIQHSASTRIVVPEPADEWIEFDNKRGTEKMWLVWSETELPEFEAVKALADQQSGEVRDQSRAKEIQGLLVKYSVPDLRKEVNNDAKQTTVMGKGSVIAYSLNLEHQP